MCPCSALLDTNVLNGLSCKSCKLRETCKTCKHNDIVCCALRRAEILAIMEPTGFSRTDG